jgi:peroxiredoxin
MKISKSLFSTLALGAAVALGAAAFVPVALAGDHPEHPAKKETAAAIAKVGSAAPDFKLKDTEGKEISLSQFKGKVVVLEWYNSGCPFVKRHHDKYKTMADTAKKFGDKVVWIAINSGAPGKEGHGKDAESKKTWNIAWPILNDETGAVGRLYGAKTTPHMFVVDAQGVLQYAGAIDNDPKDEKSPGEKLNYVTQALEEVLAGKPVSQKETKPYGCSVKYGA